MFELLSDPTKHGVQNYSVNSPATLLDPLATNPLYIGEWMEVMAGEQVQRATGDLPSYAVYTPRGDTSAQAISKVALITIAGYKAETQIMTSTSIIVGSPLRVQDVTIDGQTKSGLVFWNPGDTEYVVGHAIVPPTAAKPWLKFQASDPNRFA